MDARCFTSVWIGYHVAELAVIRLGWQNGGGTAVALPKLLAFGKTGLVTE